MMKKILPFYLTILLICNTVSSHAQFPTASIEEKENGFVIYTIDGASDEAHIFTLYGDGTFGSLSAPEHQFKANAIGYPTEIYVVEPYDPILPESKISVPTGSIEVLDEALIVANPEPAIEGEIDVLSSWATASGHENFFIIAFKNESSISPVNGSIELHFSSESMTVNEPEIKEYDWVYDRTLTGSDLIDFDTRLSWNFTDLQHMETRYVYVPAAIDLAVGESVRLQANYNGMGNKQSVFDIDESAFLVRRDPHDPNFKIVNKPCIKADAPGQRLEYTIGFFNDGNDFANDVFITDILPAELLPETALSTDAEYPHSLTVTGSTLNIDFLDINLPGTNQTYPEAYSYEDAFTHITFSICTKDSLTYDSCISNEASIVFDSQPPFITNFAVVCAEQFCPEAEFCTMPSSSLPKSIFTEINPKNLSCAVYPNPLTNKLNVVINFADEDSGHLNLSISDYTGKIVRQLWQGKYESAIFKQQFLIGELPEGLYQLVVKTDKDIYIQKLIKQ